MLDPLSTLLVAIAYLAIFASVFAVAAFVCDWLERRHERPTHPY